MSGVVCCSTSARTDRKNPNIGLKLPFFRGVEFPQWSSMIQKTNYTQPSALGLYESYNINLCFKHAPVCYISVKTVSPEANMAQTPPDYLFCGQISLAESVKFFGGRHRICWLRGSSSTTSTSSFHGSALLFEPGLVTGTNKTVLLSPDSVSVWSCREAELG